MNFNTMKEIDLFFSYIERGGFVSYPLVAIFFIVTYTSGYRLFILYKGRRLSMRPLFNEPQMGCGSIQFDFLNSLYKLKGRDLRRSVEGLILDFTQEIHRYSKTLHTAVLLAPLLGLLGTVAGMVETFSSLSGGNLFSTTGGIAGGISQALITTQFGLIVAIPGIFISRYLGHLEKKTHSDFLQLGELFIHQRIMT